MRNRREASRRQLKLRAVTIVILSFFSPHFLALSLSLSHLSLCRNKWRSDTIHLYACVEAEDAEEDEEEEPKNRYERRCTHSTASCSVCAKATNDCTCKRRFSASSAENEATREGSRGSQVRRMTLQRHKSSSSYDAEHETEIPKAARSNRARQAHTRTACSA